MKKNILILSTSPRKGGNSDTLADEFARGAQDAGHKAEKIRLAGKSIGFCRGCLACQKTRRCVVQDDASAIVEKMLSADALVFATPIYFYEMSGQKMCIRDRATAPTVTLTNCTASGNTVTSYKDGCKGDLVGGPAARCV